MAALGALMLLLGPAGAQTLPPVEIVEMGSGVPGLRFSDAEGRSLLLADAGLLGLVVPASRAEFDELVSMAGSDRPLLLLLTARSDTPWEGRLRFGQGEREIVAEHPFRLRLLLGDPERVGPDAPVVAVVLLPEEFSLRLPITVGWGGSSGTITFRR